jgi:competence protein ComEC
MTIAHFYVCVISFLLGVFVATVFYIPLPAITWLFFMAVVSMLIWKRSILLVENTVSLMLGLALCAAALGALRFEIIDSQFGTSPLINQVGEEIIFQGVVNTEPDKKESTQRLYIKTAEDLILVSTDRYQNINYGDEVKVKGVLKLPESFETDLGRVFNYKGYLKARGVEYTVSFATVEVLQTGQGNPALSVLLTGKRIFMDKVESLLPEPAAGLGEGLLLGVKQALGTDLEAAFRQTGIIHIVVLSGYNVMLVVVFIMYVLGQFLTPRPRVVMGIIAIISFALLVGLSATVVRASLMVSLLLIMQASGRSYLVLRGLLLTGAVMVLHNPHLLVYDIGFQLSFLATLGLVLIAPHLERLLIKIPTFAGVRTFLVATIATQIAVSPLLLYQIGEFSVVSVLVNVLVLPMVPVAMLLTFATGVAGFILPALAPLLVYPTVFSLQYIIEIARFFSSFSFSVFVVPPFSAWFIPAAYALMGGALWYLYKPGDKLGHSDLGINLLSKSASEVSDWTIEEEVDEPVTKAAVVQRTTAAKDELPIFFR